MAEHRENGRRSRGDDNLSGCYLLIVVGEPTTAEHREVILQKITKGFLSWDMEATGCCISAELQYLVDQDPIPEEAKNGEKLIQFVSENLVTEVLINPQVNTLQQCMKNLLSSYTKHKHVIHSGYAFSGSGSWILQDSTYSFADFLDAFQDAEVQRIFKAYENCISIHVHCAPEGDWTTMQLNKEPFAKLVKVAINPDDRLSKLNGVANFVSFLQRHIIAQPLVDLLEPSDVVGNIRFSRPTLYVFPGGQGDSALFGVNGFNMLIDGGFNRKACFWDFARHLDRVDALLVTQISNSNLNGVSSFLKRKVMGQVYPKIGHVFCNIMDRKHSPDGDKDTDSLLVSLAEEGHLMMENLRHLGLKPQNCYRESSVEPINLYHKVGHGNLDMFVLNPAKDSKEVKEFLQQWHSQSSAFGASRIGMKIADKELLFPLPNLMSICAILVWQPADPTDSITRILFPGSSPQSKIFEGLDKLRHLEILKAPVCSEKSLQSSITKIKSKSQVGDIKPIRLSVAKLAAVNKSEEKTEIISKTPHPKIERKQESKTAGKIEERKVAEMKPSPKSEEKKAEIKPISKPDTKKQEAKKISPLIAPPEKKSEPKKVVQMVGGKLIEMPKTMNGSGKVGPSRHTPADNGKSAPKAKGVKEATNKKAAEEKNIAMRASVTAKKETVKKAASKKPSPVKRTTATLSTSKTAPGTASPTPSIDLENKKISSSSATSVASSVDTNMLDNKAEAPALIDEISPSNEIMDGNGHLAAQDSAEEEKTSVDEKQSLDEEMQAEKDSIKLAKEEFLVEETAEKEKITDAIKLKDEESNNKILSSLSTSEQATIEVESKNGTAHAAGDDDGVEVAKMVTELNEQIVDADVEEQSEKVDSKFVMTEKEEALIEPENLIDEMSQQGKEEDPIAEPLTRVSEKDNEIETSGIHPETQTEHLELDSAKEEAEQALEAELLLSKEIETLPATQMAETELPKSQVEQFDFQEQKEAIVNKDISYETLDTVPPTMDEKHAIDQDLQSHEHLKDSHDEIAQEAEEMVEKAAVKDTLTGHSKEQDSKVEKFVEDITQTAIKQVVSEPEDLHAKTKEDLQADKSPAEDLQAEDSKDDVDFKAQESHVETHEETGTKSPENVSPISKSPDVKDLQLEPDFDFASMHPTESWQKQHVDGRDRPREDAGETFLDPSKVHIIFTAASSEEATDEYRLDEKTSVEPVKVDQASPAKDSKETQPPQQFTDVDEGKETTHDQHEQYESEDDIAQDVIVKAPSLETDVKIPETTLGHEAKAEEPEVKQEEEKHDLSKEDLKDSKERQDSKEPVAESGIKGPEDKIPPSSPVEKYVDHGRIPIAEETGSKLTGLTDKDFKAAVILSPIPEDAPKLIKLEEAAGPLASGEVHREVRLQQDTQECLRTPDEVADLPIHEEVPTEFEGYYQIRGPLHGIPETLAEHDDIPPHLRSAILSSQTPEKEAEQPVDEKMEESVYIGTLNADHAEVVTLSNGTSPSTPLSPKSPKDKETKEVENIFIHPSSGSAIGRQSSDEGITHFKEAQEDESPAVAGKIEHSAGFEIKKEKLAERLSQDEKGLEDSKEKTDIEEHVILAQRKLSDDRLTKDESHLEKDRFSPDVHLAKDESHLEKVRFSPDAHLAKDESHLEKDRISPDVHLEKDESHLEKDRFSPDVHLAKDESHLEKDRFSPDVHLEKDESHLEKDRFSPDVHLAKDESHLDKDRISPDVHLTKDESHLEKDRISPDVHLEKDESHVEKDRSISPIAKDSDIALKAHEEIKESKVEHDENVKDLVGISSAVMQESQPKATQPDITYVRDSVQGSEFEAYDVNADQRTVHAKDTTEDLTDVQLDHSSFRTDKEVDHAKDAFQEKSIESQFETSHHKADQEFFHTTIEDRPGSRVGISDFDIDQESIHAKDVPDKRDSPIEQTIHQVDHSKLSSQSHEEIDHAKDFVEEKHDDKFEQYDLRTGQEIAHAATIVPEERDTKFEKSDFKTDHEHLHSDDSLQKKSEDQIKQSDLKPDKEIASKIDVPDKQDSSIEHVDFSVEPEIYRSKVDVQDKPIDQIKSSDFHEKDFVKKDDVKSEHVKDVSDRPKSEAQAQQSDFRDDHEFASLAVSKDSAHAGPDSHHDSDIESTSPVPHDFDSRSSPLLESMLFSKAPVDPMTQSFYDETTATHEDSSKTVDPMTQSFYDSTTATKEESPDVKDSHQSFFVLPAESQIHSYSPEPDDLIKAKTKTKYQDDAELEIEIKGQLHDAKAMDDFASTHTKHEDRHHEEGAMRSAAPPDIIDMDIKPKIDSNINKESLDSGVTLPKEQVSKSEVSHAKDSTSSSLASQAGKAEILPQEYEGYYEVHVPPEYGFVAPEAGTKQPSDPEEPIHAKRSGLDILSDIEPKVTAGKSEQTVQEAVHEPLKETAPLSLKESISLDEKDKEELVDEYQSSSPYYQDSYSPEAGFQGDSPLPPLHGQQSPSYPRASYSPDLVEDNNGRKRSETFVGDPYDAHKLPPGEDFSLQKHVSPMEQSFHGEFPQSAYFSEKYDPPSPQVEDEDDCIRPSNDQFKTVSPMHSGSYVSADEDTEDEFRGPHYEDKQSDADSESPYHRPDLQAHLLREKVAYHDPMGTDSSDDSDADVVRKRHGRGDRYFDPAEHQQRRVDVHVQGGDAAGKFGGGLGSYWEQDQPYELASEEHKQRSPLNVTDEHPIYGQGGPYPPEADTWDPSRGLATQDFDPRSTPDYAAYHPTAYPTGPSSSDSEPQTSPELSPKGFEMDSPEVRHTPFKFGKKHNFGEEKHYHEGPESPFPPSGGASLSSPSTDERSVQEDKKDKPASKNPFDDWGEPMGLPSPPPPADKQKNKAGGKAAEAKKQPLSKKNVSRVNGKNEDGENKKESATKPYEKSAKKAPPPPTASPKRVPPGMSKSSPAKTKRPDSPMSVGDSRKSAAAAAANKSSGIPPVYVDLTYIPHHGNPFYCDVEFFRNIRARYYVFSGTNPSKEVFNALLEAKQSWENPDLEVTIIPTYDTDTLGYWFALNEDELAKNKIDLAPSASRCTINLQDHETSCSAYRLEF